MIYSLPLDESCPCFKFKRLLPSPRPPPFHAISIHSTNQLNEMGFGGGGVRTWANGFNQTNYKYFQTYIQRSLDTMGAIKLLNIFVQKSVK